MQGKLLLGTMGAIAGALVGAVAWAAITAATNFQIGYMAIGVGFLAGFGMRTLSGGRMKVEGIIAGVVALLGCILGNLLAAVVVISQHEHFPLVPALLGLAKDPAAAAGLVQAGFDMMDVLFYAFAVYAGYRTALAPAKRAVALPSQTDALPGAGTDRPL
jgi:ABC-type lipoprotein release transport system permease subunit